MRAPVATMPRRAVMRPQGFPPLLLKGLSTPEVATPLALRRDAGGKG